jgi:hypothetical protein
MAGMGACRNDDESTRSGHDVVLENGEMKLVIGHNGMAVSLVHKPTGQECLQQNGKIPAFEITLNLPYNNEMQLKSVAKTAVVPADSVYWQGEDLQVCFRKLHIVATVKVKITEHYFAFSFDHYEFRFPPFGDQRKHPVDGFTILQLPVKERKNFGEWLNVGWDEDVAVNLLATTPYTKMDGSYASGCRILKGEMVSAIGGKEAGVALITSETDSLLYCIGQVETDFNLPRGVESRKQAEFGYSYLSLSDVHPGNVDDYIEYAKRAGFRAILIYYYSFARTPGHFEWNARYPGGMADLQEVVGKIKDAGMIPGLHFHYCKAQKEDLYVSPVPDHRLHLLRIFTLARPLGFQGDTVWTEENPQGCTLDEGRRILKIGKELIGYTGYTAERPYAFTGCTRGSLNTRPAAADTGEKFGLLDVDNWPIYIRFDQNTSIQQEVAERLGRIYNSAGFRFAYFDGAEDVHEPFWYHVSKAQLQVYNCLDPAPLFAEGAFKSHFSWHILSRGNAFDVFKAEYMKEAVRRHQIPAAREMAKNFTPVNFGWIRDESPGENSIGLQPDMVEYICSRGAAWDCPVSLKGDLARFPTYPRGQDNMEVFRRWEEFRTNVLIRAEQKDSLKNLDQEHILLINEKGEFELHPYYQIEQVAGGNPAVRAFLFFRKGKTCVVYWHTSGKGQMEVKFNTGHMHLYEELDKEIPMETDGKRVILPLGNRKYLETRLSREEVISAFQRAVITE